MHHPEAWKEWVAQAPDRVSILSHPRDLKGIENGFLDRTAIPDLIPTEWGDISLVRASLALLREALKDENNTHFVLLSESCFPIQGLPRILLRLQHDGRPRFSFKSWDGASEIRKQRALNTPDIPEGCWRFHPQWWLLDRSAAKVLARVDKTASFENFFASDEAYFGTTLMMEGYPIDDLVDCRDGTWTHWESGAGRPTEFTSFLPGQIRDLINSDSFFARKFPTGADIANYDLHR